MSHCRFSDFLAHHLDGTPLPCSCLSCQGQVEGWESERARQAGIVETLPPVFWTAQEARLRSTTRSPAAVRPWIAAVTGAAALLVLGVGLALMVLNHSSVPASDDYDARYAAVQEALERSAIGDLEACGVLLNESNEEGGTAAEEAL